MDNTKKPPSYRLLILIATPKLTEKAAEMFQKNNIPVQYRLGAEGTASSEIMDTLGLGSIDKGVLISMVPKKYGNQMLEQLHANLRLDAVNSGIAFTIPLTGANKLLFNMMTQMAIDISDSETGEDEDIMTETKHALIAAVVNRGFSGEVMEAAKPAGAGGGSVLHSRSITSEEANGFWGLGAQDEKEIVLILARHDKKVAIMQAISEKCGMQSKAKGLVMSLPIDSVMGL